MIIKVGKSATKSAYHPDPKTQQSRDIFFKQLDEECRRCSFRRGEGKLAMDIPDI